MYFKFGVVFFPSEGKRGNTIISIQTFIILAFEKCALDNFLFSKHVFIVFKKCLFFYYVFFFTSTVINKNSVF